MCRYTHTFVLVTLFKNINSKFQAKVFDQHFDLKQNTQKLLLSQTEVVIHF